MSDLSDEERGNLLGTEGEEEEEAKKKVSPKRRSFGLRVAFQFPTRKSSEKKVPEQAFPNLPLKDSKPSTALSKERNCKRWDKLEGSASESEEDMKETQEENSSALLKRAMNIKENKAMVRLKDTVTVQWTLLQVSMLQAYVWSLSANHRVPSGHSCCLFNRVSTYLLYLRGLLYSLVGKPAQNCKGL